MSLESSFPLPSTYINKYLWSVMKSKDATLATQYGAVVPFFPLADSHAGDAGWGNKPYVVYDTLMRFRTNPFYKIHKAQTLYFVRGSVNDTLVWGNAITQIMDRQDVSAQGINEWIAKNSPTAGVFFHATKAFQIDSADKQREDLSLRQYYTTSVIVEYQYHLLDDSIW